VLTFSRETLFITDPRSCVQLDKYLALERTNENMINISFNEMYFIHEMLHLHKNSLVRVSFSSFFVLFLPPFALHWIENRG
jgi:hypothetical protein